MDNNDFYGGVRWGFPYLTMSGEGRVNWVMVVGPATYLGFVSGVALCYFLRIGQRQTNESDVHQSLNTSFQNNPELATGARHHIRTTTPGLCHPDGTPTTIPRHTVTHSQNPGPTPVSRQSASVSPVRRTAELTSTSALYWYVAS